MNENQKATNKPYRDNYKKAMQKKPVEKPEEGKHAKASSKG